MFVVVLKSSTSKFNKKKISK